MNYFQLLKRLYDIYDRNAGRVVDSKTITNLIRRQIPFTDCKIVAVRTLGVASNALNVSGVYDPEADEFGKKPITIEIAFPKSKEVFCFADDDLSKSHWSDLCIDFVNILGHEYMHLNQFRRREFRWCKEYRSNLKCPKKKEIQEYYGDPDEIDAYAFVAAADMAIACFSSTRHKLPKLERTRLYKTYVKYFDKDDPVVLKFTKLSNRYYKKLERQYHDTTFE